MEACFSSIVTKRLHAAACGYLTLKRFYMGLSVKRNIIMDQTILSLYKLGLGSEVYSKLECTRR